MTSSTPAAQAMGDSLPECQSKVCRKRYERPSCHSMSQPKGVTHGIDSVSRRRTHQEALPKSPCSIFYYLVSTYLPKLILEVMGGAGAIWGFSEACGLRRPETVYFWRPAALVVGALFFLRFLKQLCVEMAALRSPLSLPNSSSSFDLELGKTDLELSRTESSTTDSPASNHVISAPSDGQLLPPTERTALTSNQSSHMPKSLLVPSLIQDDKVGAA